MVLWLFLFSNDKETVIVFSTPLNLNILLMALIL